MNLTSILQTQFTKPSTWEQLLEEYRSSKEYFPVIQDALTNENNSLVSASQELNNVLNELKQKIQKTNVPIGELKNEKQGSQELVQDFKKIYQINYTRNITLLLLSIGLFSYVSKNWN